MQTTFKQEHLFQPHMVTSIPCVTPEKSNYQQGTKQF
jgi:hypothetical protein